ncbi:purine-nucleoside phosphorylase [Paenibacillus pini]|uniref:Uridine phosphorylase n=1 Tax=Paenibacillus pini JCM 16418 TaxID=1236976 RepID=W7Z7I3_9BACL|nr:purine-nucleoside phosphorylase [Paenibacillus pini]GAF10349.1 purine nucleoside phosphorylase [Paenibacillus pini JCM 16418]
MPTPHNTAQNGEIAKTVLMPGDPLRAKYIAETYLENPTQFNTVRNMFGYTGTYKGTQVSVMGSGMGMPSIGIYSYELYNSYGVENIIRIGSSGAYTDKLNLFDLVLADSAWSESTYAYVQSGVEGNTQLPSSLLNEKIEAAAKKINQPLLTAKIHSSDVFYHESNVPDHNHFYNEEGCVCVEMESYALFHNAKVLGKHAACILTISDSLVTHAETTAEERQTSFNSMMEVALEAAISL